MALALLRHHLQRDGLVLGPKEPVVYLSARGWMECGWMRAARKGGG